MFNLKESSPKDVTTLWFEVVRLNNEAWWFRFPGTIKSLIEQSRAVHFNPWGDSDLLFANNTISEMLLYIPDSRTGETIFVRITEYEGEVDIMADRIPTVGLDPKITELVDPWFYHTDEYSRITQTESGAVYQIRMTHTQVTEFLFNISF